MSSVQLDIRTLSDRLVDVVRDFILSGVIPSEEPIRQDALAAELRVSKIPLREALARLEQDGLSGRSAGRSRHRFLCAAPRRAGPVPVVACGRA